MDKQDKHLYNIILALLKRHRQHQGLMVWSDREQIKRTIKEIKSLTEHN